MAKLLGGEIILECLSEFFKTRMTNVGVIIVNGQGKFLFCLKK